MVRATHGELCHLCHLYYQMIDPLLSYFFTCFLLYGLSSVILLTCSCEQVNMLCYCVIMYTKGYKVIQVLVQRGSATPSATLKGHHPKHILFHNEVPLFVIKT